MNDRVGELLAERARLGGGAGAGIAVSILIHGSIAATIIYAAMHATAPQTMPALNIRFAQIPSNVVAAPTPHAPPPTPAPKKLTIPEPVAAPTKPVTKSEPKTVPLSNFGRSSKKGSETPPAPPAPTPHTPSPTPPSTGVNIPVGAAGVTGVEGDFPYTIYLDRMNALIGRQWLRPQSVSGITATVSFVIERDGRVRDAKLETPSGNETFDRAALRAVLEVSPLPPLPFAYNGTYLGVHLTFR